jgi:putative restriction endonuclease
MNLEQSDRELRLALFAHIERLRAIGGGVVTSAQLNEGMGFQGRRQPIWSQPKGIYKPQWLGREGAALTIQTSFDSPYDDRLPGDDSASDRFVYRFQGKQPNHADNRALRRALELARPLLYLVAEAPGIYQAHYPFYVVAEHPDDLAFELMADMAGDLATSFDRPVTENLPLKAYATRAVRQRLHQARFRYLVLRAYRSQCSMCRLRHEPLLDAAHIVPDYDERGKPEISNGLSLCKIHHSAYDVGILGISPDYQVHLRTDVLDEVDGPMLRHGLQAMHGSLIQVPRRVELRPRVEYLAERYGRFLAA